MRKSTKAARDAEKNALAEASRLREELEKKSAILMKVREERAGSRASRGRRELGEEEREELRSQVAVLQEKLRVMNTAEKPYEDEKESKIVKNAEEVARWDERKKWQKKMEEAKQRLKEADLEVSKLSKQNTSLRETVQRQEREKMLQEGQVERSPQGGRAEDQGGGWQAGAAPDGEQPVEGGGEAVAGGGKQGGEEGGAGK